MGKGLEIDEDVHARLRVYGMLGETFSDAIDRALDEAGAPEADASDWPPEGY
jgi:hypothetical protein